LRIIKLKKEFKRRKKKINLNYNILTLVLFIEYIYNIYNLEKRD